MKVFADQFSVCFFVSCVFLTMSRCPQDEACKCIQRPYMYTKAIHVYKGHTCIQSPYMYTKAIHVYKGHTCIQRPYMYTKPVNVYKGRTCIRRPYMYTKAIHVYKGRTCIQRSYMYTKAVHVYKGRTCIQRPYMYTKAVHVYKGHTYIQRHDSIPIRMPDSIERTRFQIPLRSLRTFFNKIEQDCHPKQQIPDGKWTRKPLAHRKSNNFLIYV